MPTRGKGDAALMGFSARLVAELDLMGDWGVLTTDRALSVTGWNPWLERHFGRTCDAFRGRPLFDVFPHLAVRKLDQYYRQALEGRTILLSQRLHKYLLPLPPVLADSRFEFMQQTARILPLVEGASVCGTVTVIEDVTERVADETELRERVEALREADRRKDEFLAMLAHELRNPLAPIVNAAQLLRVAGHDAAMRTNARDMIERQTAHLVRLVDDLLDVSRVSRGKITLQMMPLDLAAVARHAVETSRPMIEARRHRLAVSTPSTPVRVQGDFVRLAQVVSNLLNNAAKYTEEDGEIALTIEAAASPTHGTAEAVVKVRDNGRGIEPAALAHLFDLFYQVGENIDRSEGGLGIGLSLVKSLVELHGGSVEAHSSGRGRGSEFSVRLPLLRDGAATETAAPDPVPDTLARRILVVDDNRDSAESMSLLLRVDGHETWIARDGREAVELAMRERPDVVLLDIGLPGINGYQVCDVLRDRGLTDVFFVAMTGYGQDEDRRHSHATCFDARLVKPVELATLRRLLAERSAPGATAS
jgi:signal transduction histidine kinase